MKHAFFWKDKCWLITDEPSLGYVGFRIYESEDSGQWRPNNTIVNSRRKWAECIAGLQYNVSVVDDRAYIFYCLSGKSFAESTLLTDQGVEVAELELVDGKVVCKNNN